MAPVGFASMIGGIFPIALCGRSSLLVAVGLSPAQAIEAATSNAAALLGRADRIGSIEPGKDADLIAGTGDPTADIALLSWVEFVMRRGTVRRLDGKPVPFNP